MLAVNGLSAVGGVLNMKSKDQDDVDGGLITSSGDSQKKHIWEPMK
jgi:hypothetical protein